MGITVIWELFDIENTNSKNIFLFLIKLFQFN